MSTSSASAPLLPAGTLAALRAAWGLPELPAQALGGEESRINISLRIGDTVLQRINSQVFPSPLRVVGNVVQVCQHLASHIADRSYGEQALQPLPARNGDYAVTIEGAVWRATRFIDGGVNHDQVNNDALAREGGRAVAAFLHAMRDFNPRHFEPALPEFHQLSNRISALQDAVRADRMGRVASAHTLLTGLESRITYLEQLEQQCVSGRLPARFVHGDTKIANVLFDGRGKALAMMDLDTVMVSSLVFDFADMARSFCNTAGEHSVPDAVSVSSGRFRALADGFLSVLDRELNRIERETLLPATLAITTTLAIRFLTDHLNGDHYFRVEQAGDNLRRAAVQLALVQAFEREQKPLRRYLRL